MLNTSLPDIKAVIHWHFFLNINLKIFHPFIHLKSVSSLTENILGTLTGTSYIFFLHFSPSTQAIQFKFPKLFLFHLWFSNRVQIQHSYYAFCGSKNSSDETVWFQINNSSFPDTFVLLCRVIILFISSSQQVKTKNNK